MSQRPPLPVLPVAGLAPPPVLKEAVLPGIPRSLHSLLAAGPAAVAPGHAAESGATWRWEGLVMSLFTVVHVNVYGQSKLSGIYI